MVPLGVRARNCVGCVVAASQLLACSFAFDPWPTSPHDLRPKADGYQCGRSFWYPVVDTGSAVASATWVFRANEELDTHPNDQETDKWKAVRVLGWAGVGLFAASAVYGYVVEGRCATLRKEAEGVAAAPPARTGAGFPGSVLGFGFRMQQVEIAQLCRAKAGVWTISGSTGSCQPTLESSSSPEVQIAFELGVASQIHTIYRGSADMKKRDYQALAAGLRASYGPPQVEAEPLPPACQTSLAECLEAGVRPKGPVWHWPAGTIELVPVWADERAILDIRYTRAETVAE